MTAVVVAGMLWAAAAMRTWRSVQKRHACGLRAVAVAAIAIAVAATVDIPAVARWVDDAVGRPNIVDLIKQIGIVVAACGNQVMLLHLQTAPGEKPPDAGWNSTQLRSMGYVKPPAARRSTPATVATDLGAVDHHHVAHVA